MNINENITHDEIFSKVMLVLCSNDGIVFNQYTLYNKVLGKLLVESLYIPNSLKYKFILVLRQLMSKIDNVRVDCIGGMYYAVYKSDDVSSTDLDIEIVPEGDITPSSFVDDIDLSEYILLNNLDEEMMYKNPESGDTVYHHILGGADPVLVKKLIIENDVDYNVKNNKDETPINCIKSIEISNLIISDLNTKLSYLESRISRLEKIDYVGECSIMNFIKVKMNNFYCSYGKIIHNVYTGAMLIIVMRSVWKCVYKD
jgi:hypothetical protein